MRSGPVAPAVHWQAMKTILTPIDLSDAAEAVTLEAGALAGILEGRVLLLHAIPPSVINEYAPEAERIAAEEQGVAEDGLKRLQRRLKHAGVDAETEVRHGPAVATILDVAEQRNADYIVMGSHGHGSLYNLLVGSTASGVIHAAPCPVVIIPTHKAAASLSAAALKTS
jgi:nucleotide-binding universal stress UspA family protein